MPSKRFRLRFPPGISYCEMLFSESVKVICHFIKRKCNLPWLNGLLISLNGLLLSLNGLSLSLNAILLSLNGILLLLSPNGILFSLNSILLSLNSVLLSLNRKEWASSASIELALDSARTNCLEEQFWVDESIAKWRTLFEMKNIYVTAKRMISVSSIRKFLIMYVPLRLPNSLNESQVVRRIVVGKKNIWPVVRCWVKKTFPAWRRCCGTACMN